MRASFMRPTRLDPAAPNRAAKGSTDSRSTMNQVLRYFLAILKRSLIYRSPKNSRRVW
jgi:hypothetical protein